MPSVTDSHDLPPRAQPNAILESPSNVTLPQLSNLPQSEVLLPTKQLHLLSQHLLGLQGL